LQALRLLVAACEQASLELQAVGWFNTPLLHRLDETHDLAVDAVRSRLSDGQQHGRGRGSTGGLIPPTARWPAASTGTGTGVEPEHPNVDISPRL